MPSQSIRSDPSTNMVCTDNNLIEGSKDLAIPDNGLVAFRIIMKLTIVLRVHQ
jgi:hypothetical protein